MSILKISRFKQSGHILVFVSLFLIALSLSVFSVFDSGQLTLERTKLQTTADSAAYTAAVIQSRELNFHAYTNRAMAANHVTVAQMVSLSSYFQNNQQMFWNLELIGDWLQAVPYVGQVINKLTDAAEAFFSIVNEAIQNAGSLVVVGANELNKVYSESQSIFHGATVAGLVLDVEEVIRLNDPDANAFMAASALTLADITSWENFVKRYEVDKAERAYGGSSSSSWRGTGSSGSSRDNEEDKTRLDQYRDVVLRSRDEFTSNRDNSFWESPVSIPGIIKDIRIEQRGGSEMGVVDGKNAPYYSFSAKDTMSIRAEVMKFKWGIPRGYRDRELLPLGWGRQVTHHSDSFDWYNPVQKNQYSNCTRYCYNSRPNISHLWRGAGYNSKASRFNDMRDRYGFMEGSDTIAFYKDNDDEALGYEHGEYEGLQNFFDLTKPGLLAKSQSIRIFLAKDHNKIGTTDTINKLGEGLVVLNENPNQAMENGRQVSMSKGESYFSRPRNLWQRKDGNYEYGNIYNPYWQPRLIALEQDDKRLGANIP
ncbi:Tad domain-containing protein [Motilimonas pumila]|uniref:Putative Flp pilus-assembly TadG-like N-terminal domain-containing protein n=1 Tax=Motilimonas pumila TaxID=2303987 RepID=A0A418YAF5_9GAMM|nr:Tad domain-containing protein [Motilimonas pumila]RJG39510.1 hypothetical protein D1Z90_17895 [Motilimonas pumila]